MRSLRVKFTIHSLMLAVTVVALLLTLAVRMHPQPVHVWILISEDEKGGTRVVAIRTKPHPVPSPGI
jgi:hypothetical protein